MLDSSSARQPVAQETWRSSGESSRGKAGASSAGSASGTLSEDEFFDSKSHLSSEKVSAESTAASASGLAGSDTGSHAKAESAADKSAAGLDAHAHGSPPKTPGAQRFRSLTNSRVPTSGSGGGSSDFGSSPSSLRRSATAKHSAATAKHSAASSARADPSRDMLFTEERARRAAKAMADACTTGISIRESDKRRERAFNHILVEHRLNINGWSARPSGESESPRLGARGGFGEQGSVKPKLKHHPLHQVSSHNRITGFARGETSSDNGADSVGPDEEDLAAPSSATPGPDGRTLSMTHDRKAITIARSASLEARIDRGTRKSLSQWIMCFGAVNFDADQGPTLSLLYPHVPFSDSERAAVSFSSMPDSTIYELYDSVYTFHFRVDPVRLGLPKDQVFLYGHVFFRQKRDPLMRRGGFQRSVVIISHLPYHGLFSRMAHMLGPLYFDLGTAILEAAAHNVSSWPAPTPGASLELPFLGTALSVELPASDASQLLETSKFPLDRFDPGEHILASITCDGLFRSFRDALGDLWACWELMILGEPLVVLADTPARCSEAIVSMVDIIFPITYCGDYRPYFTIQDPDFRAIVSKTHVPANTVVGVSNPFFSEAMGHWPHKLFLGSSDRMSQMHGASVRKARAFGESSGSSAGAGHGTLSSSAAASSGTNSGGGSSGGSGGGGGGGGGGISGSVAGRGIKQGLQTRHKCVVSKDRPFAEHLLETLKTGKQPPWIVNNMLRRYFIDLTVQFLAPLNRYFTTLIPQVHSSTSIPSTKDQPKAAPWNRGHRHRRRSSLGSSSGIVASPTSLAWFTAPSPLQPWRTDDFMASLALLGISPQLSGRHSATKAADVLVSVFSGGDSSANGSSSSNSTAASTTTTTTSIGTVGMLVPQATAGVHSASLLARSSSSSSSSFSLWRGKKSSKKISDEWLQLYSQFLKCGNFATWLAHRTNEAQRALLTRFRQEVCQGDVHAWCRGYDYPLAIDEQQLAAEIEMLDLATMDLGQSTNASSHPHVKYVFYHGQTEDERRQAERHRQQLLRERQERLAWSERPVHGSDGALIGYSRQTSEQPTKQSSGELGALRISPPGNDSTKAAFGSGGSSHKHSDGAGPVCKQLGQRITHAKRAQSTMLQAAWQVTELLGEPALSMVAQSPRKSDASRASSISTGHELCPPNKSEKQVLLAQLSILLEYMSAEAGCLFLPLVAKDYVTPKHAAN